MADIEFSNASLVDLDAIDDFSVDQFGEEVASKYMRGFDEAFALLQRHPLSGRPEPSLKRGVHCLTHKRHRIFYTLNGETVLVLRIIHHAADAQGIIKRAAK